MKNLILRPLGRLREELSWVIKPRYEIEWDWYHERRQSWFVYHFWKWVWRPTVDGFAVLMIILVLILITAFGDLTKESGQPADGGTL